MLSLNKNEFKAFKSIVTDNMLVATMIGVPNS